jgi:hypothetical protein
MIDLHREEIERLSAEIAPFIVHGENRMAFCIRERSFRHGPPRDSAKKV